MDGASACLDLFYAISGVVVSDHKADLLLVILDSSLEWYPTTWTYVCLRIIVQYLDIPFGVDLSPIAMWDWCLQ
jgi:hypothetical protein